MSATGTGRGMRIALWSLLSVQVAIAGFLFTRDVTEVLERKGLQWPWELPEPSVTRSVEVAPVGPGDQRRQYEPDRTPRRARFDPAEPVAPPPIPIPDRVEGLRFSVVETGAGSLGRVLTVFGEIRQGDSDRLERALDRAEEGGQRLDGVALHSPGGQVTEAMRMGRILRDRNLGAAVTAEAACVSACPLVLLGGAPRRVSRAAWVGLHQAYLVDTAGVETGAAVEGIQALQASVMEYTGEMGADPLLHIHAFKTPPEEAYYLLPEELTEYQIATELLD